MPENFSWKYIFFLISMSKKIQIGVYTHVSMVFKCSVGSSFAM